MSADDFTGAPDALNVVAAEILEAAQAAGVHVEIDGDNLLLEAPAKPPAALVDAMRRCKPEIIALLRSTQNGQTTSLDLLRQLGAEVVLVESEATATQEISALLAETAVIGLDTETAPRREYAADAGAALDPLKAEVRLLQIATESNTLVIDPRKVPLSSPALMPIWRCALVGHNLSFDIKMQPAETLWALVDEPIVNKHVATIDELDDIIGQRCAALANERDTIKSRAGFHWWPKIASPK